MNIEIILLLLSMLMILLVGFLYITAKQNKASLKKVLLKQDQFQNAHEEIIESFQEEKKQIQEILATIDNTVLSQSKAELDVLSQIYEKLETVPEQIATEIPTKPRARSNLATAPEREVQVDFDPNPDDILSRVRKAIKADQVELLLQPIVSLPQRKPRYFECYSRIKALDGGSISPEHYIDLAEQAGLMPTIDNAILFRSIQIIRKVQKKDFAMGFFVNISERSLADRFFMESLIEFIDSERQILTRLYFEIKQDAYEVLKTRERKTFDKLISRKCRFSYDQPKTLDLNLKDLQNDGFAYIKLDQNLLLESIQTQGLEATRNLKKSFDKAGIDVIATKIENENTLKEILDLNVDYGQGFLFGLPSLYR